ncbi:MAG: glycosyltransferase [Clostridium sp.]|uniref:glycosyltransferase n=1 Tax=Clostridium sp. TaxID=1506 RepID=UPI003EE5B3EC
MDKKFSVLLSVYKNEKPEYLKRAIESIYYDQTLKPNEIILVEDGPLTTELYSTIEKLKIKLVDILKIVKLEKNSGLGVALNRGILKCKNELVARMDTDDIAYSDRFEKQIKYMIENSNIDVLGSYMTEFVDSIENIVCIKDAPTKDIKNYMKYRDPVNHPTVILKKSKVLEAGNYQEILLNEDSYLWRRMLVKGAIFYNLPEPLLYFRVTNDTYKRRGGWRYVKAEWILQKKYLKLGVINKKEFIINIMLKTVVRIIPNEIRKIIYLKVLRKRG